jgi:hypothetical protein
MIWRSLRIRPLFLGSSLRLKGGYEFGGAGKHVRPVRLTSVFDFPTRSPLLDVCSRPVS